ncbi:MAG: hypothetical protein C0506_11425 [Anaerolinea sp.]|nr:hypothetical protein [Anaerolinea sp.]
MSRVIREAEEAANGRAANFLEGLAARLGLSARAGAVFGDPVEKGSVTVIPVAKVRYGFGGGSGSDTKETGDGEKHDEGSGGGGGLSASPVGFIEIHDGFAEFKRINDPLASVPVILAGGAAAWLVLRGLRAVFR